MFFIENNKQYYLVKTKTLDLEIRLMKSSLLDLFGGSVRLGAGPWLRGGMMLKLD